MSYAESITPGPFDGPALAPPPWAMRHMHRMHKMRGRMTMAESGPSDTADETGADEHAEGRGRRGGHRGGHRHGPGPGPWGRGPWGPPRGRRRDRGDVRAAILLLLAERPRHGYEIITELTDRSEGRWQPSPGSIYPMLKRLSRDGLVTATPEDGKAVFSLTDDGRTLVEHGGCIVGRALASSRGHHLGTGGRTAVGAAAGGDGGDAGHPARRRRADRGGDGDPRGDAQEDLRPARAVVGRRVLSLTAPA